MRIILFLTGTIAPQNVPNLERTNVNDRENDYYNALQKWMKYEIPVVFCDNSNFESKKIQLLFDSNNNCEYIKFKTEKSYLGKGHGEAEILIYAYNNSELLQGADLIIKITGRYTIANFLSLIKKVDKKDDIYSNIGSSLTYADSRFFMYSPYFFNNYFRDSLVNINEERKIYMEHILARAIHQMLAVEGKGWKLISEVPIYEGYYGTENKKYYYTFFKKQIYKIYHKCKLIIYNR